MSDPTPHDPSRAGGAAGLGSADPADPIEAWEATREELSNDNMGWGSKKWREAGDALVAALESEREARAVIRQAAQDLGPILATALAERDAEREAHAATRQALDAAVRKMAEQELRLDVLARAALDGNEPNPPRAECVGCHQQISFSGERDMWMDGAGEWECPSPDRTSHGAWRGKGRT